LESENTKHRTRRRENERKGARYYNSKSRPKRTVRSKQWPEELIRQTGMRMPKAASPRCDSAMLKVFPRNQQSRAREAKGKKKLAACRNKRKGGNDGEERGRKSGGR
jgi:hypothetical protein